MKKYLKMNKRQLIVVMGNTKNPRLKNRLFHILTLKAMGLIDDDGNLHPSLKID